MDLIEFLFDLVTSVLWSGRRKKPPPEVNQRSPSNAFTPGTADPRRGEIDPSSGIARHRLRSKRKPAGDDGRLV